MGSIGISTMCACALGNIAGDVSAIFAAAPAERAIKRFATSLRLPMPKLSDAQKLLPITQAFRRTGCVLGVICGCVLGMFPLQWPAEWRLYPSKMHVLREQAERATKSLDDIPTA